MGFEGFPVNRKDLIIRYTGLMDYDGLYLLIVEWFKARGYWFEEGSYKHKVPSALGAEQEIDFTGTKRVTNYLVQNISLNIHIWDMTEVDVERNGIKKKLTNGRIQINMRGDIALDFEGQFKKSSFWEGVRDFLYRYLLLPEITGYYGDQLYYRLTKLQGSIKKYLDMQAKANEYAGYMGDNI